MIIEHTFLVCFSGCMQSNIYGTWLFKMHIPSKYMYVYDLMLGIWRVTPTRPNKYSARPAFMLIKIVGMFHVYKTDYTLSWDLSYRYHTCIPVYCGTV